MSAEEQRVGVALDYASPRALWGGADDRAWQWLNSDGPDECPFLARHLPSLPPDEIQQRVNGETGHAALASGFRIYRLFKSLYEQEAGRLEASARVLDFGCGWGRVTRFFLRDVEPENLVGIDVDEAAIAAARATNRWCRFEQCDVLPPSTLEPESFDLVCAYSVFSHLSEEAHLRWLEEFERVLRPGGVALLTTLARGFIERSAGWASGDGVASWQRVAAAGFADTDEWLAAYDRAAFCFAPLGKHTPHFGFAAIPEAYVRTVWPRHLRVRSYGKPDAHLQPVIVCRRR